MENIDRLIAEKETAELLPVDGTCWNCQQRALIENSHGVILCECCGVRNDYKLAEEEYAEDH